MTTEIPKKKEGSWMYLRLLGEYFAVTMIAFVPTNSRLKQLLLVRALAVSSCLLPFRADAASQAVKRPSEDDLSYE